MNNHNNCTKDIVKEANINQKMECLNDTDISNVNLNDEGLTIQDTDENVSYKYFEVNPNKGVTIKDINDTSLLNEGWWKIGYIKSRDIGNWKSYKIRYYNKNGDLYMRPVEKYHCKNFENIFAFGSHCEGFSTDKIIKIKFN